MAKVTGAAPARKIASGSETRSDHKITAVETYRLKLPYRNVVAFKSVKEAVGEYVILRLVLDDGTEGLAESVCRPSQSGEDATSLAYMLDSFFKPLLIGADPLGHLAILERLNRVKFCRSAKAMIDVALWDLRGKILGQPVWRLLGGADPEPIPLTWIAHGNTREAQVEEARRKVEERGFKGMKLKTWRRSFEDVRMVGEVRQAIGDDVLIYVDGNGSYSETEARTILAKVQDFNVALIEEPCSFADPTRQAALAASLPIAMLADQCAQSIDAVQLLLRLRAAGAISVKLRRTGFTNSLKIITLCEAAGVPAVIGTDSESRIGALVRMHLRAGVPSLAPWPTETHFFEKLADDAFAGDFRFQDGQITIDDTPGFGASIDRAKLETFAFYGSNTGSTMRYASEAGNFTAALAGDCMLTRRLSIYDEPEYLSLVDVFRKADVGFVNLEGVARNWDEGNPGITTGTYMTVAPALLEDLKWFGVNLVCCANNHAFDYGEGGVLANIRHLDAAGIAHAGSGRNLSEARMPGYLETRNGRVALIATTATFRPWNRAGEQRPDLQGRPGINPFRFKTTYQVDGQAFDELKRLGRELGFEQTKERNKTHFYSDKELGSDSAEAMDIFGQHVVRGNSFKVTTEADPEDVEDILRWVREARRQADWVIVTLHSHEFGQRSLMTARTKIDLSEPADFIPDFARAVIDAGADIFAGHGSHTPLGIELYKGKPIFYSLGNIIFQNETVPFFPAEAYARFGLGPDATPADFLDARTSGGTKGHVAYAGFWQNIAAETRFEGGKLKEIRLHPIDQGFGNPRAQRGRPVKAKGKVAEDILARIDTFSRPYGVRVKTVDGIGVVTP